MNQILKMEQAVPSFFTYDNGKRKYNIELTDTPFLMHPTFEFVWDANRLEKEVAYIIETWKEPLQGEMLILTVCLINILAESHELLLTSHMIIVVVASEE